MCGITGFWLTGDARDSVAAMCNVAELMAESLKQRGPDDYGTWADASCGLVLGHRRLAIVDLSNAGHQPMGSTCGRWKLVFNGEIYNHLELRSELKTAGVETIWRGNSDTETILACIDRWGLEETLQRCVGMFAIALWDLVTNTLTLARDRFGEKPLYYGWVGKDFNRAFVFGSELKALKAYPAFDSSICREALAQYLRFAYVPAPRCIYKGIYKLEPGCLLTVKGKPPIDGPAQPLRPGQVHFNVALRRWWSLANLVVDGANEQIKDEVEAIGLLENRLSEAIKLQSLADVPLGAFLSGGVDSSTIVALMQQQSLRPVKTFTIGFEETGFDESPHARAVADHLGTDHHEMLVSAQMALDVIPTLPEIYDEPFADSSQIPTHLVCRAARQHVTVALSGDAGDELFGGYNRYVMGPQIWNRLSAIPAPLRSVLAKTITAVPIGAWDNFVSPFMGRKQGLAHFGDKVHKLAESLSNVKSMEELYKGLVSEWSNPGSLVLGRNGAVIIEPYSQLDDPMPLHDMAQPLPMMYRDSMTYLADDILCKVDRAAMACSLETRVPFLDHRIVQLAWQLPLDMKVRGKTGKWALRQVLYKFVPKELIDRPKTGFAIPIGNWLRGPLRGWVESLINVQRLNSEGYLRSEPIRQVWAEHLSGRHDHSSKLWTVLMFQAWLEKNH